MGPVSRVAEYKAIETTYGAAEPATDALAADATSRTRPQEALAQLYLLPGAHYSDPEFSWRYAVAPAGIGFVKGSATRAAVSKATCCG